MLGGESEGVETHLLEHCHQAIAAGRGEVFTEIDTIDEIEVGLHDLLRRMVAQYMDKQRYDAFHKNGIRVAVVKDMPVLHLCREPYFGLTTVNQVLLCAVGLRECLQTIAIVDKEPYMNSENILEVRGLKDFVLYFVDRHLF